MHREVKIAIIYYSFTGNTAKLAGVVAEGAREIEKTNVGLFQLPEVSNGNHEGKAPDQNPVATVDDLVNSDGVAFGSPTHFGSYAYQWKAFIDQMTPVWLSNKLVNKPVAFFCSAGSLHGGEEVTLISMMIPLMNLGMIPVGIPYPIQGENPDFDAGSPYGAISVSGHTHANSLTDADKKMARILGNRLAIMAHILNCNCEECSRLIPLMKKL